MSTTTKIKRREMVTLAKPINKTKPPKIGGWLISEKLDGTRCFWDGGLTRGMLTQDVPWAGLTHPKTLERKTKIKAHSTGLWSRYGNPIMAPEWFLDALPPLMLDGELWAGRGNFQRCRSIVAGDEGDDRWEDITYMVYGAPSLETVTQPGLIKNANQHTEIPETALQDMLARITKREITIGWAPVDATFAEALQELTAAIEDYKYCQVHLQRYLSTNEDDAWADANQFMDTLVAEGAEGAIIRNPDARYELKRTGNLLKFKPFSEGCGKLVGFTSGEGKYTNMIGALILDYKGKQLKLSGLTDAERVIRCSLPMLPGEVYPNECTTSEHFKIGQQIEFMYRELSDDLIPKEARFKRAQGGVSAS